MRPRCLRWGTLTFFFGTFASSAAKWSTGASSVLGFGLSRVGGFGGGSSLIQSGFSIGAASARLMVRPGMS